MCGVTSNSNDTRTLQSEMADQAASYDHVLFLKQEGRKEEMLDIFSHHQAEGIRIYSQ